MDDVQSKTPPKLDEVQWFNGTDPLQQSSIMAY